MFPIDYLFIVYCIYLPFLISLYIIEMIVIIKPGSKLRGSFYTLFIACGVADLSHVASTFQDYRIAKFPLVNSGYAYSSPDFFTNMRNVYVFVCPVVQDLLNCAIALNRLTCVIKPIMWKRLNRVIIPFIYCFAFLL
ncbi:hypothetical protein PFISCL1PPCAC_14644, partial [Pristionchus fissidentatus]